MPRRLSDAPMPGEKPPKPSIIIEGFWWVAFIVPMIFAWMVTQSWIIIGGLLALRLAMIAVPRIWKKKGKAKVEKTEPDSEASPESPATVKTNQNTPNPYIEEARAEWYGLLKFLKIYDKEKEEKYLMDYRRFRGWE